MANHEESDVVAGCASAVVLSPSEVVRRWLDNLGESTRAKYRLALRQFEQWATGTAEPSPETALRLLGNRPTMTNSHAPGTWYLAPSDDLTNEYSAGYDGNSFATREEAEAAIEGLGEAFGDDAEWVAVQRRPDVAAYLAEIVAVGKRYGFSLSHEDHQGGFLVEERNDRSERWLLGAKATPSLLVTGLQRVKGLRGLESVTYRPGHYELPES